MVATTSKAQGTGWAEAACIVATLRRSIRHSLKEGTLVMPRRSSLLVTRHRSHLLVTRRPSSLLVTRRRSSLLVMHRRSSLLVMR